MRAVFSLPASVWLLGLVSFCNDAASELLYPLLPLYLTSVLMSGPKVLGLIEGVAEALSALSKLLFGAIGDRVRSNKGLVVAGYALAACALPAAVLLCTWVPQKSFDLRPKRYETAREGLPMHTHVRLLASLALLCLLNGCGSDGGLGSSTRQINDVDINAAQIRIGESTGTDIFFETETDFSGKPANVEIVVRISPALEFVDGSSFIYDNTEDDRDARGPNYVSFCDNGPTFLVFNLTTEDLDEHSLNGGTQYGMRLSVAGRGRTNHATVSATAGSDQEFSCEDFPVEESDQVEVR